MTTRRGLLSQLIPWQDREFVEAFDRAYATAVDEGLVRNGPRAAARVQTLLRDAGYGDATIECDRSVDDALDRAALWTVRRDSRAA